MEGQHDAIGEQTRSLRAPSSEPSLSHREDLTDNNRSPSRKRPRLDSGSRTTRSMSADRVRSSTPDKAAPAGSDSDSTVQHDHPRSEPRSTNGSKAPPTPSRITINIREPKDAGGVNATSPPDDRRDSKTSQGSPKGRNGMNGASKHRKVSTSRSNSPRSPSSPLIEVEVSDTDDTDDVVTEINIDGSDEDLVSVLYYHFPFAQDGDYVGAAELILQQLERGLDFELLSHLNKWMKDLHECLQHRVKETARIFYEYTPFWDVLAKLYQKLFNRTIWRENNRLRVDLVEAISEDTIRIFTDTLAAIVQVDAGFLRDEAMELDRSALLSPKFVIAGRALYREDKGFVSKVLPNYGLDQHQFRHFTLQCFAEARVSERLSELTKAIVEDKRKDESFLQKLVSTTTLANHMGVYASFYQAQGDLIGDPSQRLAADLLEIFESVNDQLTKSLDKQQDLLSVDGRKNLVDTSEEVLNSIFKLAPERIPEIFEKITGHHGVGLEVDWLPVLSITVWKIKLMNTYISKGRMELRLQGIDLMQALLVKFFNDHKERGQVLRSENPGPLLCFVADILLKEKITEYFVGVASHPQLISRSGNVIGFLVVTNKFSTEQIELIWKTILDGQDPRIVAATYPGLGNLIKNLTIFQEDVLVCKAIMKSPLPPLTTEAAAFFGDLLQVLRTRYQEYHLNNMDKEDELCRIPLQLCIEIIRVWYPGKPQSSHTNGVFEDATTSLASLAPLAPPTVRKALFQTCLEIMQNSTDDGAAAAQAMFLMIKNSQTGPNIIAQELGLVSALMDDLCAFVASRRDANVKLSVTQLTSELHPRLDLIWYLAPMEDDNIDSELLRRFWSHLVGADALGNTARDVAWQRLAQVAFYPGMENAFLEKHQELLSPTEVKPQFFTSGYFSFIEKLATSRIRRQGIEPIILTDAGAIEIPGLDIVWESLLSAPAGVTEDHVIQWLAATYLDKIWIQRTSKVAIEATHVWLVDMCMDRLKKAHQSLRETAKSPVDSDIIMTATDEGPSNAELSFLRTIKFLSKFILYVRSRAEYRSNVIDRSEEYESGVPAIRGDPISVKCEIHKSGSSVNCILVIGTQNTARQLHRRVCALLAEQHFSSFQLLGGGKRMHLLERPRLTLEDMGLARAPHLILREANINSEDSRKEHIIPNVQGRSAFEERIISRLDDLYSFLDGTDNVSASVSDFLRHLPKHTAIKELVANDKALTEDVFARGQPFKMTYALGCLREVLEETLESKEEDETFVPHGTLLLEDLLLDDQFAASVTISALQNRLVADIVSCLYEFVASAAGKGFTLFSKPALLTRALANLCLLAIPSVKANTLFWDGYELLLDLCLQLPEAWAEFTRNPRVQGLHEQLFFDCPDAQVRLSTTILVRRKLEMYPQDSHLQLPACISFLWSIIYTIIPRAIEKPENAAELFELATFLFKNLLDSGIRTEEYISDCFKAWSQMIIEHNHREQVGRDDVDVVLRGLAMLLRLCAISSTLDLAQSTRLELVQIIWWKHLFQQSPHNIQELRLSASNLPVLESTTRIELVQLLAALADDMKSLELLCDLAGAVGTDTKFLHSIDRTAMLRSPAGYVGLKNLGNTCYMNALVTQLFMNPMFRASILTLTSMTNAVDSPLLCETQKLFATMQNSYSRFANAADFTEKIVTLTEEFIDVREQMDVDEFMNTLFLRWEEQMPSEGAKEQFRSIYTGKTIQQIKSKECEHVSEREDTCLAIQCDIAGKATLEESLRAFTEGDVMEGDNKYKCEPCGKLVDAVKRTCLKEVPDHVMLQLKRFAFDLDYLRRSKINDHFAFPMTIDMNEYTFERLSQPDDSMGKDMFDLVGVIVHKGQADHGHYVSYIRARPDLEEGKPVWLQFDDSDVSIFDAADLAEACYGGLASKDAHSYSYQTGPKTYNAYMLFYQRRSSLQSHPWAVDGYHIGNIQEIPLPTQLERDILQNNATLLRNYSLFDESHRELIRSMHYKLEQLDHFSNNHALHSALLERIWSYFANIWSRTKDLPDFENVFERMRCLCRHCDQCCYLSIKWLIDATSWEVDVMDSRDNLRDFLLRSTQPKVRQAMRLFIVECMKQLRKTSFYGADVSVIEPSLEGRGAITIITRLAMMVPDGLHWNFRAWEDFWGLLSDLATLGPQECWTMIQDQLLTPCFELILCGISYNETVDKKYSLVVEYLKRRNSPPYNNIIRLAATLFNYVDMQADAIPENDTGRRLEFYGKDGIPWTDWEEQLLLDYSKKDGGLYWLCEMFQKWDIQSDDYAPVDILRTLLMNGKSTVSHGIVNTFEINIREYEPRYADPFLRATTYLALYLRDREHLKDLEKFMREISRNANPANLRGDDGYNGLHCQRFWMFLHNVARNTPSEAVADPAFFDNLFTIGINEWAPALLLYTKDYEVGRITLDLLKKSMFDVEAVVALERDEIRSPIQQATAIRALFWGCDRMYRMWSAYREQPWKQFAAPLYHAMSECCRFIRSKYTEEALQQAGEVQEEDEVVLNKFEELTPWFEALPMPADDELAQSSELTEDWGGLDIADDAFAEASDLTEVSDDDIAATLTGNLDQSQS